MLSFTRRSTFKKLLAVGSVPVVLSALLWAQHPVVPVPHPPAAPVHVYAPPIYHAPVVPAPILRPPVIYAPTYTVPRSTVVPVAGIFRPGIVLPPVRPMRPIHRIPPVIFVYAPLLAFGDPFWRSNLCWWENCDLFWLWTLDYTGISHAPTNYVLQVSETPVYVCGDEREDLPQLYLKDGTILNVTDYWVVDNQLHFKIIEETGQKPVEHLIPFEDLDLQKTVDANTKRGFRFVLRNEPFEEYVRDHPEGPPPIVPPQQ